MIVAPIPSRLGFVAVARAGLDWVTGPPYSMWLTSQDEGRVEYEGEDVALVVLHDPMSYELDLAVWRPSVEAEVKRPFAIVDMMRVTDFAKARDYRRFAATHENSVRRGVTQLVSEFRSYGLPALEGNARFYREMSARDEAAREFGLSLDDQVSRGRAEQAWGQRDYGGVVEAYRSIKGTLSRVEQGRLRYSAEKAGNTGQG
jgi:hypothetical protein